MLVHEENHTWSGFTPGMDGICSSKHRAGTLSVLDLRLVPSAAVKDDGEVKHKADREAAKESIAAATKQREKEAATLDAFCASWL